MIPWLSDIKSRLEKATPRYYKTHIKLKSNKDDLIGVDCCEEEPFVIASMNRYMDAWKEDLDFIAHCPTDIARLLKAVEIMEGTLEAILKMNPYGDGIGFDIKHALKEVKSL